MPLREEIVRGVRAGSILLAVLLAGYAVYRVAREPGVAATKTPEPAAIPAEVPAHPATSPLKANGPAIPPPPPPKNRRPIRAETQLSVIAESKPEPEPIVQDESKDEAKSDLTESDPKPEAAEVKQAAEPVAEDTAPSEGRGKKVLKAVGRFLHIGGKKDPIWQ